MAEDNVKLGTFQLSNLKCVPKGTMKIRVVMTVDYDGLLSVSAQELREGGQFADTTIIPPVDNFSED
jgi:molecular chaperone DnaK (HSP70)